MLTKRLGLAEAINERLVLFKVHRPHHESDHVLNIAYNHLAGGTRLEHHERCGMTRSISMRTVPAASPIPRRQATSAGDSMANRSTLFRTSSMKLA
jgi:hypothetical protein